MSAASAQLLTRALAAIDRLEAELAAHRSPIAVVGLGCRLPGALDVEAYWSLLRDGLDAVGDVPADRWDMAALYHPEPATPGRMYTTRFGSLPDLKDFDAGFFGIAPREAASVDPQQRLVLEVAWEALEDAGIPPDGLGGSATGVFMAACGTDYFQALLGRGEAAIDPYFASGTVHSMVSGRLSYVLGLTGPSLSVDTACSSSLVAVHLACRALRNNECSMALAGGVNRIILPTYGIAFAQSRMLSPDGRCKTFDASADGYGRAEGCGVVVLKRLADAQRAGDRILGVIRGSAVNQDGATSGLTVPNGPAQAAVIRAALADGGVLPGLVGLVEAHGTGTSLGDPIEMGALRDVFSAGRTAAAPLLVGSVKTNIGHAEGAAGVAGLIKLVLALRHRTVPGHLHLHTPSPLIDWAGGTLAVPQGSRPWTPIEGRWIGGVSAFGFSGTNAHVVVEAGPADEAAAEAAEPGVYVVSGKDAGALDAAMARHAAFLPGATAGWGSLWRTAATGRSHFAHRAAVVASDAAEAAALLRGSVTRGRVAPGRRPQAAFLFTGQGAVVPGMGLDLPAPGAAVLDAASALLEGELSGALLAPLRSVLGDAALLSRTDHAQPALYAVQCALVACWRAWGVAPSMVLGHSVGEYAAAQAAGVFDFATGLRLVTARGRLMQAVPGDGAMVAVALPAAAARALVAGEALVSVGAENGPCSCVLSGSRGVLERIVGGLDAGVARHWLGVSHGFHSPQMRGVGAALGGVLAGCALRAPGIPMVTTGGPGPVDRASYWMEQVEAPVRFGAAMASLGEVSAFVEVGPQAVLLGLGRGCVAEAGERCWVTSLVPGRPASRTLLEGVAALHVAGVAVQLLPAHAATPPPRTTLPTYPWQRTTHWAAPPLTPPVQAIRGAAVDSFYSRLSRLFAGLEAHADTHPEDDVYLTFAPFPAVVPDFSWIMTSRFPEARAAHFQLCLSAQRQMRDMLFRHVDFTACTRVLDIGCGNGSDVVALARRHPHLTLTGQTIAAGQAAVAHRKAHRAGVADRVTIRHADSIVARSDTPFDVIFAFEMIHHVADKPALFAAIADQLTPGGRLVAADFIASPGLVIDDDATMSGFLDAATWSAGLARAGLAVTDAIDVSDAVANFLEDPALEAHLDAIGTDDADIRAAFRGFVRLGALLRRGDVRYVLLDATRCEASAGLASSNADRLDRLVPFDAVAPERWQYERRWRACPPVIALHQVATQSIPNFDDPAVEAGRRALPLLEALSDAYAHVALAALGETVAPQHRRLAELLRDRARAGDIPLLSASVPVETVSELALVQRCGQALPAVLRGEMAALDLLFPDGDMSLLTHLYQEAPVARALNASLGGLCGGLCGSGARVLELGGGTGGSTSWVLDGLGSRCASYCFTDVSDAFLGAARLRFGAGRPGFTARRLDIEQDPAAQGFAAGGYDLVVAANVLHATRDLRASLRHAVGLLAPGGSLVLLEGSSPRHWVDLTFGLTEGWWRFADLDLRPSHPLLEGPGWAALLAELGLETAVVPGGSGLLFDQALVVGRRAAAGMSDWLLAGPGSFGLQGAGFGGVIADGAALARALEGRRWAGVAVVAGATAEASCRSALTVLQGLGAVGFAGRVALVTRDAVSAAGEDGVAGFEGGALWGLGAAAALEHPEWLLRRVDIDGTADLVPVLAAELAIGDAEDQVAWRGGVRLAARLERRAWPPPACGGMRYRGTWLVTGGLGGLGLAVAGWLLGRGVSEVVLVSRRPADPGVSVPAGCVVRVADVTDRAALGAVIAGCPGLRGVVHAAGVLDDGLLGLLDWARFASVLAPKVVGARHLDALTAGRELDGFVLFSSAASLLGNAGQASHGAANGVLDALAAHRRARGLPGLAINWGAWADIGAAASVMGQMRLHGYLPISTRAGLDALAHALDGDLAQVGLVPMVWDKVAPRLFLAALQATPKPPAPPPPMSGRAARPTPTGSVEDQIAALVEQVLGGVAVDRDKGLFGAGLDSLMSVELRNQMQRAFGIPLSTTVAFDHPTVAALAVHVGTQLAPRSASPSSEHVMSDAEAEALIEAEMASLQAHG